MRNTYLGMTAFPRSPLTLANQFLLKPKSNMQANPDYTPPQTTAFAKLTILPHPFALNSALTTPPMRFPIISFLLLIRTAALSSKRM